MNFDDLDLANIDAINAYLDDPVTQAVEDDAARAFRRMSASDKQRLIGSSLKTWDEMAGEAAQALERLDPDDPARASLQRLLDLLNSNGDAAMTRLRELRDETARGDSG